MIENKSGTVVFDCPPPLIEAADRAAKAEMLSRSAWLRRLIKDATDFRPTEESVLA
jgi:hypothetical protein